MVFNPRVTTPEWIVSLFLGVVRAFNEQYKKYSIQEKLYSLLLFQSLLKIINRYLIYGHSNKDNLTKSYYKLVLRKIMNTTIKYK